MKNFREFFAILIFALWAYVVIHNPADKIVIGAMITIVVGSVIQYFYGSTKAGSETATKNAEAVTQSMLGSNEPKPVIVANTESEPVPTMDAK